MRAFPCITTRSNCALNLKKDLDISDLLAADLHAAARNSAPRRSDLSQSPLISVPDGGVVGGSRAGPVVTPHTLELTARGRVLLQLAPPETARAYLPPEYRPGRVYSDTDSEKVRRIHDA